MLLTPREVAERLKVSLSTVYGLVESGKLACYRIGLRRGAVRVSEEDLAAYLESCHHSQVIERQRAVRRVKLKHIRL